MRVLLIGKGGREHALAWKIRQSPLLTELLIWPGHAAMSSLGKILDLPKTASWAEVAKAAEAQAVDLVVCGPEAPLAEGLCDLLMSLDRPIPCFGPKKDAAALESSKAFAKDVMKSAGIPTAAFQVIEDADAEKVQKQGLDFLQKHQGVVLKASGLASGKGVFVCHNSSDIEIAIKRLYGSEMAASAKTLVLEEILVGRECSYFSFLGEDGATGLGFAVDYKRLKDGDQGPNTGGMGCYAPVPWLPEDAEAIIQKAVIAPLLLELKKRDISYQGCIYVGLMWTASGPKVIEFNVRLGDPEAEVLAVYDDQDWLVLMALKAGLKLPAAFAIKAHKRNENKAAVAVVIASKGYPYGEGEEKSAQFDPSSLNSENVKTFAGAISGCGDGHIKTASGRVFVVASKAETFAEARLEAYKQVKMIAKHWPYCQFRSDIGERTN